MDIERKDRITRLRDLNDAFRRTFSGGKVMMTCGVDALPDLIKARALQLVRIFDDFSEDNDPYGEHDFGSFELANFKFFWKIDYYDERCEFGSEDPADPERTTRVLTLMLASEY
jgi:uncharacterized protein DUF3768